MRTATSLFSLLAVFGLLGLSTSPALAQKKVVAAQKVLFDGPHPTEGGWCADEGLHIHEQLIPPKKGFTVKKTNVYKFTGKVNWICGQHPLTAKTFYEKNDRHPSVDKPYGFPMRYQFDKAQNCYKFNQEYHWICGQHPETGNKMYTGEDRHFFLGKPAQFPENYTEDKAKSCWVWHKPEIKVAPAAGGKGTLQVAPKKDDDKDKKKGLKKAK